MTARTLLGGLAVAALGADIALGAGLTELGWGLSCPDVLCTTTAPSAGVAAGVAHRLLAAVATLGVLGSVAMERSARRGPTDGWVGALAVALLASTIAAGVLSVQQLLPTHWVVAHRWSAAALLGAAAYPLLRRDHGGVERPAWWAAAVAMALILVVPARVEGVHAAALMVMGVAAATGERFGLLRLTLAAAGLAVAAELGASLGPFPLLARAALLIPLLAWAWSARPRGLQVDSPSASSTQRLEPTGGNG